jgi:hypothetical protein
MKVKKRIEKASIRWKEGVKMGVEEGRDKCRKVISLTTTTA